MSQATDAELVGLARRAAGELRGGVDPGWSFGRSETSNDPRVRFRLAVWREFERRRLEIPVCVPWHGSMLNVYLGNDLSKSIFVDRAFEPNEFAFLASVLGAGETFVDVGANEGAYSVFAARLVGSTGRVVAIEPSAREFDRLVANVHLNCFEGRVDACRCAASDDDGSGSIAIACHGHEGQNTIGETVANEKVETLRTETVDLVRLDAILERVATDRVDVIKIDAEGSEARVLAGATRTLDDHRPVVQFEVEPDLLARVGSHPDAVVDALRSHDYSLWVFDAGDGYLRPRRPDEPLSANVVAGPRGWTPPVVPRIAT